MSRLARTGRSLVRRRGLEPLCLAALAPQASASANFATSAGRTCKYIKSRNAKGMRGHTRRSADEHANVRRKRLGGSGLLRRHMAANVEAGLSEPFHPARQRLL